MTEKAKRVRIYTKRPMPPIPCPVCGIMMEGAREPKYAHLREHVEQGVIVEAFRTNKAGLPRQNTQPMFIRPDEENAYAADGWSFRRADNATV